MAEIPTGTSNRTTQPDPRKFPLSQPSFSPTPAPLTYLGSVNYEASTGSRTSRSPRPTLQPRFLSSSTTALSLENSSLVDLLQNSANINLKEVKPSAFSNLLVFNAPFYFSFEIKGLNKKLLHSPIFQALTIPDLNSVPNETRPIREPMLESPALPVEEKIRNESRPIPEPMLETPALPVEEKMADLPKKMAELPKISGDFPVEEKIQSSDVRNVPVSSGEHSVRVPVAQALAHYFQKHTR